MATADDRREGGESSGWLRELPPWARELLLAARIGRLGLLDDSDRPRVLPITFAVHEDFVWTAIDRKPKRGDSVPARIGFVRRRPEVALTVDRYSERWERLAWVQLLGRATVLAADREPRAVTALVARYRQYRDEAPPGPLIRIKVSRALCWRAR